MCITHYIQRKQYDYFNGAMIMSNSVKQRPFQPAVYIRNDSYYYKIKFNLIDSLTNTCTCTCMYKLSLYYNYSCVSVCESRRSLEAIQL